jgi:ribosomal protein S4
MKIPILRLLVDAKMTTSMSEGRRAVWLGAVSVNGTVIDDFEVEVQLGDTIKIGHRSHVVTPEDV